jgi:hypothetical protein
MALVYLELHWFGFTVSIILRASFVLRKTFSLQLDNNTRRGFESQKVTIASSQTP